MTYKIHSLSVIYMSYYPRVHISTSILTLCTVSNALLIVTLLYNSAVSMVTDVISIHNIYYHLFIIVIIIIIITICTRILFIIIQ